MWERFVATSRVKSQIRRFFRSKKRDEYILFGKEILSSFFMKENYELNSSTLSKIKKEFNEIRGEDFNYIPLLGDREPALDYRN